MKQQKKWILRIAQALFCALILTACGGGDDDLSEPVTPTPPENPSDPTPGNNDGADIINFEPSINGMATRGTIDHHWDADGTEKVAVKIADEVRQYYVDEHRCMVSTNPFSWDGDFTDHDGRSVTAWYPYSATLGIERSVVADQQESGYDTSDFLYGTTSVSYQGGGTWVYPIRFDHQISKLIILVNFTIPGDTRTVTGIQVLNTCLRGTFTAPESGNFGSWTTTQGSQATITAGLQTGCYWAIAIPQTITTGTDFVTISLSDNTTKTFTLPFDFTMQPGMEHECKFNINEKSITLTTTIKPWVDSDRGNPGSWSTE